MELIILLILVSFNLSYHVVLPNNVTAVVSQDELEEIMAELWEADDNAVLSGHVEIDFGNFTTAGSRLSDTSPNKLFTRVDAAALNGETYETLRNLFDNYNILLGETENITMAELTENDLFLDAIVETKIMNKTRAFLMDHGFLFANSKKLFRTKLEQLWFTNYRRWVYNDSSGFEHVFIGELSRKTGKHNKNVQGLQNWYRFFDLEKSGHVNHFSTIENSEEIYLTNVFSAYDGYLKRKSGIWIGTSPEFEIAVYTICFLLKQGYKKCKFHLGSQCFAVTATPWHGQDEPTIKTAFPSPVHCSSGQETLQEIMAKLWEIDNNTVLSGNVEMDFGNRTTARSRHDQSPNKLFTYVNTCAHSGMTYRTLRNLFDNYEPFLGVSENTTGAEQIENDEFLDAIMQTKIMIKTRMFLKMQGLSAANSTKEFQSELKRLWFTNYKKRAQNDSSAFEHVFIGELDQNVKRRRKLAWGQHYWYRFYVLEKSGHVNHIGTIRNDEKTYMTNAFSYDGNWKRRSSFWIGTSPEFEMAAYTICYFVKPGSKKCKFSLGSQCFAITTQSRRVSEETVIKTAFPSLVNCKSETRPKPNTIDTTRRLKSAVNVQEIMTDLRQADENAVLPDDMEIDIGVSESVTSDEIRENDAFVAAVSNTTVMEKTRLFLKGIGFDFANSKNSFKTEIKRLWFTNFYRKSNNDTSAFEHVFIGEFKNRRGRKDKVSGMHNWYRYYELEKSGELNHFGYISKKEKLFIMSVYQHDGYMKAMSGMWIGTSPEFEMAVYTICFLTHPGSSACKFMMDNHKIYVTTYPMTRHGETFIGSAFPYFP